MIGAEEKQAVADVLDGPILVHGPRSKQFEDDFAAFTGAPHAVSVANCTAGLHLIYFHLGLGPGDEVIVPAQTHAATAHAVALTGATPVFVDAELTTGNIDPNLIEAAITANTRALSVVHFLGLAADMEPIMKIARKHDLYVVEDCAIAIGATHNGTHVGLVGDAGTFSFYPVKHMTTAEGGMVITKHHDLARSLRLKRAFGVDRTVDVRKEPGIYDVVELGFNYRMNEIEAAIGIEQLKKMRGFLDLREHNSQALRRALSGQSGFRMFDERAEGRVPSYYCLSILLDDDLAPKRQKIVARLKEKGIGTSVYYPRPVPHLAYYREKFGHDLDSYPVARRISDHTIALPVGPHLNETHM
ncbi:MAG TPA: DegT/DnrJ/EryC1/StrS family aminotransferase, partial [Rhodospirillales bacterium]|nr:DegT/DnrJ/EryC1/StrS family aminotransferase [Rhodospirillales bacterium]